MAIERIEKSELLSSKIRELRQMKLFEKTKLKSVRYETEVADKAVMNDFHSSQSNGGYGRSKTGGIYYKWYMSTKAK